MVQLNALLFTEANPIPVKWATHKMGYGTEGIRLPLVPHSQQYRNELLGALIQTGVKIVD